jgi:lauroyl/myristoyl acyltransferase
MATPEYYFMPYATMRQREDGRWDLTIDWADSQVHYTDEDGKDQPSELSDEAQAVAALLDEWVKAHPTRFIIRG